MIDSFKRIGEEISKEFDKLSEIERKKAVLDCLTIPIKETYSVKGEKKPIYEIIIDLNTNENKIIFKIGSQLRKENRTNYFCFAAGSNTSGKKTYFTTNKLSYHLFNTIPDTISYIDEIKDSTYDFSLFKEFLTKIRDTFYKKSDEKKGKYLLDGALYDELTDDESGWLAQKIGINKKELVDNFKEFSLYFNGKTILETPYFMDYIQLRYYHSVERFFKYQTKKGIKDKKRSHFSGHLSQVTRNVDIPIKFYITDQAKPVMFENFEINNSYKSFCLNQPEYEHILIGCNFVLEKLKESFNGVWFLLIPKSESYFKDIGKNTDYLKYSIQKIENKGSEKDHVKLQTINKCNFYFDMMFYEKDQSAFNIFKIISDISTLRLKDIDAKIVEMNVSAFRRKLNIKFDFSLNTIWNSLYSQVIKDAGKEKQKIYRSDLLAYLDIIYSHRLLKESKFVSDSMRNIKKGHYLNKRKEDSNYYFLIWNSFESLIFFRKLNLIRGVKMEPNKTEFLVELKSDRINDFFHNYPEVFGSDTEDGREKQGLTLLGYLINQIIYAQKGKSSTFLDKINYDGIKKEKIHIFINEVIEFLKIYNTKERPLLEYNKNIIAVMQERVINIEKSSLKREEITYYILLGNFLGSQIGIQSAKEKSGGTENGNT